MDQTYWKDIFSQPESLKICAERLEKQDEVVQKIWEKDYDTIIFTGMGSSNYCAVTAELYLAEHGIACFRYSASELLHSYRKILDGNTLLIITSQSGESGEVVHLLESLPEHICVVGITNDPDSTLARRSTYCLMMNVKSERSVTTRTYMAGIAITLYLAMSRTGVSYAQFLKGLLKCMKNMEKLLEDLREKREELTNFPYIKNTLWLLGRGGDYGTALAGALFFREVARVMSTAELCGEFRHGPFEVVDEQFTAILITTGKEVCELDRNLAENIRGKGGYVLMVSAQKMPGSGLVLPDCDKWYQQFLTIIPLQILADTIAGRKGITAGEFRWGSKITRGE